MRGREFLMKDLYSFSKTLEEHNEYYERAKQAYFNVFRRVGLGDITYLTLASGGSFSKYSHEFQTLTEAGEDTIYLHEERKIAVNKEVYIDEVLNELGVKKEDLVEKRAAEVGNIFSLGTRFSEPLGLSFLDEAGVKQTVIMGSYGIGIGRIMGVVVEALSDEKGIVWPESISPFDIHLIEIPSKNPAVKEKAERLYRELQDGGKTVLYDDRTDARAGEKFADAELIGIPKQVIVSERGIEEETVEIKERISGNSRIVKEAELM
jgi:prolyl-tRNA synthetase